MKPFNVLSLLNVLKRAPTILEWFDRHRWAHVGLLLFCGMIIAAGFITPWYEVAARTSGSWPHHNFFLIQKGQPVGRGDLVAFIMRPDYVARVQPGHLQRDYADVGKRWMKRIVGVPGDHIVVKDNVVYINGQSVGRGFGLDRYGQRIQLAPLPETIPEAEYYVALPHPRSFDSRYYGLIRQARFSRYGDTSHLARSVILHTDILKWRYREGIKRYCLCGSGRRACSSEQRSARAGGKLPIDSASK